MINTLIIIALVIAIIVAVNELSWLDRTDLAWPLLGISVAIGLLAIALLRKENEK